MSFGKARATYAYTASALTAHDNFNGMTSGTALNGRVAPAGGTWATSGTAPDFTSVHGGTSGGVYDYGNVVGETMMRDSASTGGQRLAILPTSRTDTEVGVWAWAGSGGSANGVLTQSLYARYVDGGNFLRVHVTFTDPPRLELQHFVGSVGVPTLILNRNLNVPRDTWYGLRLVVFASGRCIVTVLNSAKSTIAQGEYQHAALATGGALASGGVGFADQYDFGTTAPVRHYDDFSAATPPPEPIACHAGQSIEFRHDSTLREDATGTYSGPPPQYTGGRFYVPNAGGPGRATRVAVMAKRNDVETTADDHISDALTVQVFVTPRFLVVPR